MQHLRQELKALTKIERRAWRGMMAGSEADARTVRGEEGHNYLAWCVAADACRGKLEEIEAAA